METTKKRTREEVRAAFRAFMREREEEQKAAQIRSVLYHPERQAEIVYFLILICFNSQFSHSSHCSWNQKCHVA